MDRDKTGEINWRTKMKKKKLKIGSPLKWLYVKTLNGFSEKTKFIRHCINLCKLG